MLLCRQELRTTAYILELTFRKVTGEDRRNPQVIRGCPYSPSARIGAQGTGPKLELCFGGSSKNGTRETVQKWSTEVRERRDKGIQKWSRRFRDILVLVFNIFLRPFSAKDLVKLTGKAENALRSKGKSAAIVSS